VGTAGLDVSVVAGAVVVSDEVGGVVVVCAEVSSVTTGCITVVSTGGVSSDGTGVVDSEEVGTAGLDVSVVAGAVVVSDEVGGVVTICTRVSSTVKTDGVVTCVGTRTSSTTGTTTPNERSGDWIFVSALVRLSLKDIFDICISIVPDQ
jgi:hypothetical protein